MASETSSEYPRDLIGYAGKPPDPKWPGGARIAVNFVLNVEEGSEPAIVHGDSANTDVLSEIGAFPHPPGVRDLAIESVYEYGSRAGFWRILRTFADRRVPVTAFACAMALERTPAAAEAMVAAGWDFCSHGWRWINHFELSETEEREHIEKAVESIRRTTGERPHGWYCRYGPGENTRRLVVEEGGFTYDSDCYNDDLPYWVTVGDTPHLIVPYTLDNNDAKFAVAPGYGSGEDFYRHLCDGFDQLYEEGQTEPKMMSIGLHQRLVGKPGRTRWLARFIDHVLAHDKVWLARRVDIARHWIATHPWPG